MRYSESYRYYKKAVEIDTDYLDAWKKVHRLHRTMLLPQPEADDVLLEMLRLDPLMIHFSARLEESVKLKTIWKVIKGNQRFIREEPSSLVALPASANHISALKQKMQDMAPGQLERYSDYVRFREKAIVDPWQILLQHNIVKGVWQIMQIANVRF